jgi:ferredoxin
MVVAMIETARSLGWPENHIHSEQFTAPPSGEAFKVKLSKTQIEITVPPEMSLLEAIEAAGVDAPYLCRGGACGRCELEVVCTDGNLLHHDHYLSDAEKAAGKKIMPCVSRAKCDLLEVVL